MKNKGFTLIELLATLIILALITSVVTVVIMNSMQKAKEKEELNVYSTEEETKINIKVLFKDGTEKEDIINAVICSVP